MGKYLEDKELDSVLENYFESLNESTKLFNEAIINGINYEEIRRNGKQYRIKIPSPIISEYKDTLGIIVAELKKIQDSKKFKNFINNLYKNNKISSKDIKLTKNIEKNVQESGNFWILIVGVGTSDSLTQDEFYAKDDNGVHMYDFIDEAYKNIKNNKKIKSMKYLDNISNGDDYFGIDAVFKICKIGKEELIEIQESFIFNEGNKDLMGYTLMNKKIDGINISINENNDCDEQTSINLINKTYNLIKSNYDNIIKRLSENFDIDPKELKLYQIVFSYSRIVAQYSPTKKDGLYINYEFCFEPKTAKGKRYFDAVGIQYYVLETNKGYKLKYGSTYNI